MTRTAPDLPRSFFTFTATRPVAITMMVLAVVVFGLVGLARLPVNLLPDISYPTLTIRTQYPGAAPRDVEERVSERVQEAVSVVPGVRRVISVSRPEVSDVILDFAWGTSMVFAISDVRERLDRVFLPAGAERPLVLRYDPSIDPVLTLGLTSDIDATELRHLAEEDLKERLQVDGVAAVKVRGGDEEEILITVDEDALTSLGLDIAIIGRRLAAENVNAASGSIEEGRTEFLVRALGEYESLEEIEETILETRNGVPIRLLEVARVDRRPADKEVISRIDGRPCVLLDIQKEAGANIVGLCQRVKDRVFGTAAQRRAVAREDHLKPLPPFDPDNPRARSRAQAAQSAMTNYLVYELQQEGIEVELLQDQSRFIQEAVDDVLSSAAVGGLFAIAVIYLFLRRFQTTAILAVSIPISLVATFAPMFMSGIDLNIMSLGGLALGVGMLVDNSIVVLESIARMREEGNSPVHAAVLGVRRVASAVVASTLTTVAVFFPIVFVEGVAGQLFRDQALTVVFALLMSLLVALFVIPMLATRGVVKDQVHETFRPDHSWVTAGRPKNRPVLLLPLLYLEWGALTVLRAIAYAATVVFRGLGGLRRGGGLVARAAGLVVRPCAAAFQGAYSVLDRAYPGILRWALARRPLVLAASVLLLAGAVLRIPKLGSELLPEVHQGEFWVDCFLPRDATVERTDLVARELEKKIGALPQVDSTFLASGIDKEELNDSDQGEHSSRILVALQPGEDRERQELEVKEQIRAMVEGDPRIQSFRFARPSALAFTSPFVIEVMGHDLRKLRQACQTIEDLLGRIQGLADVRSTLQRGNPEVAIRFDRDKLAALDLDPQAITAMLRTKVLGDVPTLFAERERKLDMRVRLAREDLSSVPRLMQLNVNPSGYPEIPLSSVAEVRSVEGPSEIRRIGNLRGAEVHAALAGFDLGGIQEIVQARLNNLNLPRGITARLGGQKEELEQSSRSLTMALLLAVFLVYVVMASQFESLVQPLVILFSMPMALVGVVFALDLLNIPLSIIVFLGAIVLAGIVVNNAIILIDQINRERATGTPKMAAIVTGAQTRLRPVLMTTLTTVLGLLPLTGWLLPLTSNLNDLPVIGSMLGSTGGGVELRGPLAITVIAGLLTSTLLTMLVIPVIYSLSDRKA